MLSSRALVTNEGRRRCALLVRGCAAACARAQPRPPPTLLLSRALVTNEGARRMCAALVRNCGAAPCARPRPPRLAPSRSALQHVRAKTTTSPTPHQSPATHGSHPHQPQASAGHAAGSHGHPPHHASAPGVKTGLHKSPPAEPTRQQLKYHFYWEAVPMIAFGFMDQSILIHAGNAIDCSLGVMFGLSTLTAAAFGSIVSMLVGLATGGSVERMATQIGLPHSGLTAAQRTLPKVQRSGLYGTLAGAMLGCTLGMLNLLLVDTSRSEILKLQALSQDQEYAFEVEASNKHRPDATTLTVKGPDVDGSLASMTAALTAIGCSLVELHATSRDGGAGALGSDGTYEDVFIVRPRGTKQQVPDDELDDVAMAVLAACKDPLSAHSLKSQVIDLTTENEALSERIAWLEKTLDEKQIKVERSQDATNVQSA